MADPTLLSWINAEVERALATVRDCIAKFTAAPGNEDVLRACPEHLHQVSGALRMVGLNGATLVCETIEGSFAGFNGARPSAATVGVIDRAVLALKDFVGELARGQADVPLRLFPVYRDLAQLKGAAALEKDLFFPDLAVKAPAHRRPKTLKPEALAGFVNKQRALFQRGLLAWLRNPPAGLEEMRRAVNQLHKVAEQLPEPRGVWWVAHGFLDAIGNPPDKEWLAGAKALGTKIERQMSSGVVTVSETLLRELLYAVAKCPPSTPRQKEIRRLYQLDSLFPRAEAGAGPVMEFDIERLEVALYDLHSRLDALKSAWVRYVSGEQKSPAPFRELVAAFKAKAKDLGNQHFVKLLDAISVVAPKLPDPYPRQGQAMVIEMASTFLLVEHVIDNFTVPAPDLDEQIAIMGGWLLDAATGKSTGEPPPGLRADFGERVGALHLRSQVAKEILANLQHVEQVLDAFARDPSKRASLPELQPYLRQMHGALSVLGMARAADALSICERLIAECAQDGHPRVVEDMDWIAEGLSSVGYYLEPCRHGREPADEAIALFFRRYERRDAPASPDTTQRMKSPVTTSTGATRAPVQLAPAPAPKSEEQEMLEIFLEEAGEVLQTMERTLPGLRAQPEDREALTTVRRAFHTLKGSGRMVGLMDLGEVAWEAEQVMNLWLEEKRPASAALLAFAEQARKTFAAWVAQLRTGRLSGGIDGAETVEAARKVKAQPAPEDTTVGGVSISRAFLEIYLKEAAEHVANLEAQGAEWRKAPGSATSHEFMRAAHTLASSSRTAGYATLADLAAALEEWTPFAAQTAAADGGLVEAAIRRLRAMTESVARREAAATAEETAQLQALTARLAALKPAPVEAPAPIVREPAPAAPVAVPSGREKRVLHDDIDEQLLPVFLEEAEELVPHLGSDLRDWKANPADANVSNSLRRLLHTLKGSARMAGAIRLGELCHIMESRIETALEANAFTPELFAELEEKMDRVSTDVERMRPVPAPAPVAAVPVEVQKPKPKVEAPLPVAAALLRVNADTLDHLINESGEVAIARSRIEAELRVVKQALSDLGESVSRLRGQLREVEVQADSQMQSRLSVLDEKKGEFDPLEFDRYTRLQELTRLMAESLNDVTAIQQTLFKNVGDTDAALLQQARIGREVQQELMRIRAVPFSNLNERLYRIVRQTARDLDKKVELAIEGGELELDRGVLERIGAPLEHMLRNALAHGVEAPAARAAAGKAEAGRIAIALRQESNEMVLVISDDGAGLDLERLRQKGVEMGLLGAAEERSEADLAQLVFVSGLSTAESVSELSGRGVGMDVVRSEIAAINGRVDIISARGKGTTFTVYLPLTLAVTQAVLVRCGPAVLAISSAMVEQVLRLKAEALAGLYQAQAVSFQERAYPLHYVRHLLGAPGATEVQPYNSVLLLRSGVQRIALHIDELVGNQEVVVKAIGPQLARVPGVAGATVLADGAIVLIVNPVVLAARVRARSEQTRPLAPTAVAIQPAASATPVIMVVDDSLTVRKFTTRLLEREGYRVATAKDGVDALEQLKDVLPSVMLVDIEMPRMDGFDLTRNIRGDARTQQLPIIVISSRTAEKHRTHAAQLGVNAFLGKPYPESELLQLIAQYAKA
jgi:chemosensory pili system protein ChpA (sensor histidine kinase/response regulator)